MNDLVTGEAVILELQLAKLPSRALAFGIDLVVMVVALVVLIAVVGGALGSGIDEALGAAVGLVIVLLVFVGYPVTVETLSRGRSIGKMVLGLRVVREDGGPIRFRQALTRGLAGFIVDFGIFSLFTGAIALITSLASPRGRRVGDMLAGTVVLRERVPVRPAPAVQMPATLASWAGGAELSGLPDSVAQPAREFLLRAVDFDPEVRASMAEALAAQVAGHISPEPPPGTRPEQYLSAVLAERRRREEARLSGQRADPVPPPPPPADRPAPGGDTPPRHEGGGFSPPG